MEAGKRTLSSDVCHLARLCARIWDPVEGIQGREKTGRREPLSPGKLHLPATTSPFGRKWGGPREGRKKLQNEAVWWPRVLMPAFPSFLVALSLHFPGACARSSVLPSAPISPPLPGGGEWFSAPAPVRALLGTEVPKVYAVPFPLSPDGLQVP